ncbi:hypothetical protein ACJQWK_04814 [Exserohilum turcicum]
MVLEWNGMESRYFPYCAYEFFFLSFLFLAAAAAALPTTTTTTNDKEDRCPITKAHIKYTYTYTYTCTCTCTPQSTIHLSAPAFKYLHTYIHSPSGIIPRNTVSRGVYPVSSSSPLLSSIYLM